MTFKDYRFAQRNKYTNFEKQNLLQAIGYFARVTLQTH